MRVLVTQRERAPLDLLREHFGGAVRKSDGVHRWSCSARLAESFLLAIRPYTRVKSMQVDVALRFQARRIPVGQGSAHAQRTAIAANREKDALDAAIIRDLKAA